jgi:purine-binding chemotaxis protein CheW
MSSSATEGGFVEYLTFFIDGDEYAIALRRVREVIPYDTVTRVPQMPPALRGVTNLRGQVVPVVDLATKFHGVETPIDRRTCIVLVETTLDGATTTLGLVTERVGQVLALADADVVPPPGFGAPIRAEFLCGMGRVGSKFALLLDTDRLLTTAELLSSALAAPPRVTDPTGAAAFAAPVETSDAAPAQGEAT